MLFDTHAHYDDEKFEYDRFQMMENLPENGIAYAVNIGTNLESSKLSVEYAEKFDHIYATVGFHPEFADKLDLDALRELAKHKKVVAIGEIGLDYYWEDNPAREIQIDAFKKQMDLAKELDLPVSIHNRDATGDITSVLLEKDHNKVIIHCCSVSLETAKIFVKKGYYISFAGPVSFKNAGKLKEVAAFVPDDLLLIETDAPYLTPHPFRGQRNDSTKVLYTAQALAEIRGVSLEEIEKITFENAKRIYNI